MGVYRRPKVISLRRPSKSKKVTASTLKKLREVKKYDRSTRGTNPANLVVFRGYGFPDALITNLQYCDTISLIPTVGAPCPNYGYRLTSLFDPDYSGSGGQPYYFDQIAAVYGRYMIRGAKITVNFSYESQTAAGIGPSVVGIQCAEATNISSTNSNLLRMTANTSSDILSTQSETKNVVATYSPYQAYGNSLTDSLTADVGANPSRNWFAWVFAAPQGTDLTKPITAVVTIEYNVQFTQLKTNSGS